MPIAEITAAYAALKSAIIIGQGIAAVGKAYDQAEMRMKLAEMMTKLADTQMAVSSVNETLEKKDQEIAELKQALEIRGKVVKSGDAYFMYDAQGQVIYDPFCTRCFEVDHKLVHLVRRGVMEYDCPQCKQPVGASRVPNAPPRR